MANVSVDRVESALDLVTVIADPERAKATLAEMREQAEHIQELIETHRKLADDNAAKSNDLIEWQHTLESNAKGYETKRKELAAREAALDAQIEQLNRDRQAFEMDAMRASKVIDEQRGQLVKARALHANEMSAKTGDLDRRQKAIEAKEKELAEREAVLVAGEKDYTARIIKLRELVG